jgi:hypothetical protein
MIELGRNGYHMLTKRDDNPLGAGQMHSYAHGKCSLAERRVYRSKAPSLLLLAVFSPCAEVCVLVYEGADKVCAMHA